MLSAYFGSIVTVHFPVNSGFIKVNVNQTGFYRVNYDLSNWYDIIAHLRSNPNSEVRHQSVVGYILIYPHF